MQIDTWVYSASRDLVLAMLVHGSANWVLFNRILAESFDEANSEI